MSSSRLVAMTSAIDFSRPAAAGGDGAAAETSSRAGRCRDVIFLPAMTRQIGQK
jgi:hypothetical protein